MGAREGACTGAATMSPPSTLPVGNRDFERLFLLFLFITAVPNTMLCAWGEDDSGGHVL
jgi:hypothetical protein